MKSAQVLLTGAFLLLGNLAYATGLKIPGTSGDSDRPWPVTRTSAFPSAEAPLPLPRLKSWRRLAFDDASAAERQAIAGPWGGIVAGSGPLSNGRRLGLTGANPAAPAADLRYDAFVYADRSQLGTRSFVHLLNNAPAGTPASGWHREGIGVEHRASRWRWAAELSTGSSERTGLSLSTRWKPAGPWALSARYQSISSHTPLAVWQAGAWGGERALEAEYTWSARRRFHTSVTQLAFSDGSQRIVQIADWQERWIDQPLRKLATTLGLRSAHNVGTGVNWLGGEQGQSVSFEIRSEQSERGRWMHKTQRRWLTYAGVTQQPTGNESAVHGSNYEETLELRKGVSLKYLVGREVRPVEGVTLRRNYATVALLWQY